MSSAVVLTQFHSQRPRFEASQAEALEFLAKKHAEAAVLEKNEDLTEDRLRALFRRFGVKPNQISKRGLESYEMSGDVRSILRRAEFFSVRASEVFEAFYAQEKQSPSHMIHTTCTGYVSPSPAQRWVTKADWALSTQVTHAYHMGCYASIPSVRMALGFVRNGDARVDVVHTEMCSLHMNASLHTPEQMVVQSLFADGYMKYSAVPAASAKEGFKVDAILERIIPNTTEDMTWVTADWGMHMTLSREVPEHIAKSLGLFVEDLVKKAGLSFDEVRDSGLFAVHPGGPRIIDSVQSLLGLKDTQVEDSKAVLYEYGNMSSATLPHVWARMLSKPSSQNHVISLAFGPGLTMFGAVFERV